MTARRSAIVHFVVPEGIDDPRPRDRGQRLRPPRAGRVGRDRLGRADVAGRPGCRRPRRRRSLASADGRPGARRRPDRRPLSRSGRGRGGRACASSCSRTWCRRPFADADPRVVEGERRALRSARRVIATSEWTRSELVATRRRSARPGRGGEPGVGRCAARDRNTRRRRTAVRRGRRTAQGAGRAGRGAGAARAATPTGPARSPDRWTPYPDYADRVATLAAEAGIGDRVTLTGALTEDELDRAYQRAGPPRRAVARGELRHGHRGRAAARHPGRRQRAWAGSRRPSQSRAAVLVPPDQPRALTDALRRWMVGSRAAGAAEG